MTHRGAVDADQKTGDGSGILTQLPYPLFHKAVAALGHELTSDADLAVGVFFFPSATDASYIRIKGIVEEILSRRGIRVLGWRQTPLNHDALGKLARATCPHIEHLLLEKPTHWDSDHYERQLYLTRRETEHRTNDIHGFYMPSLSSRLISYKALAMPAALRAFYLDLQDPDFTTALALYHQRFSTNTFPAWPLGQPFRMMCHNGEINTVEGNRNWMSSREEFFSSPVWGDEIDLVKKLNRTPLPSIIASNYSCSRVARSNTQCACWCPLLIVTTRKFPTISERFTNTTVRSQSHGMALPDSLTLMAPSSAPPLTAMACAPRATSSPKMACSTLARKRARWYSMTAPSYAKAASAPVRCFPLTLRRANFC
jgi:glutamate synthase domain-containing protein 1